MRQVAVKKQTRVRVSRCASLCDVTRLEKSRGVEKVETHCLQLRSRGLITNLPVCLLVD